MRRSRRFARADTVALKSLLSDNPYRISASTGGVRQAGAIDHPPTLADGDKDAPTMLIEIGQLNHTIALKLLGVERASCCSESRRSAGGDSGF